MIDTTQLQVVAFCGLAIITLWVINYVLMKPRRNDRFWMSERKKKLK